MNNKRDPLRSTLNEPGNKETMERGKKMLQTTSEDKITPNSTKVVDGVIQASDVILKATNDIIDALALVIGGLQDQTTEQKQTAGDNKLMMEILQGELLESQKANRITRRFIFFGIILMMGAIGISMWNVHDTKMVFEHQKNSIDDVLTVLRDDHKINEMNEKYVKRIEFLLEKRPTITILPDSKNKAILQITQQVEKKNDQGRIYKESEIIKIPIFIGRGTVLEPIVENVEAPTPPDPIPDIIKQRIQEVLMRHSSSINLQSSKIQTQDPNQDPQKP